LGLSAKLDVVVTSQDAGATKPKPEIFRFALQKAGLEPDEAIYVGDQYEIDVLGAKSVGMKGILIDRPGSHADITDCLRIRNLTEMTKHL
jgi:putative hydrolase of the HAD superfamily